MVLKIHGSIKLPCGQRVACICNEKKIPYEFVPVDMSQQEHKKAPYTDFQPFGQVPYIDDDGFILFESRAICRYLVKKYANQGTQGLIPSGDLEAEAIFERGVSIEIETFNPFAADIAIEKYFKARGGGQPDEKRVAELVSDFHKKLDVYELLLSKHDYIGGDEVTLADLFHLPFGCLTQSLGLDELFIDHTKRPNVARWWTVITNRSSWIAVVKEAQGL
ncbi:glutathione S-transferase [Hygrophoropsis aurantiaca]|uniref:Glutathione S-transferase n=1 Tax=Hygrophoropsis aurantiaca TaxID=72124 RepID=A0ACB8AJH3_9AGAM|nr:glutathione S-transferase [Hygrophoropsis aurantiaca]